jgi:hypothetical protein
MSKRTIAVVKAELDAARAAMIGKHIDAYLTPEHIALLIASTDMLIARFGSIHARRAGRLH